MASKFEHKVEIIHEASGESFEYIFTANEDADPNEIFKQLVHDLSIIVHEVEEFELDDCDGCGEGFEADELTEDENAGLKFCNNCQEENENE